MPKGLIIRDGTNAGAGRGGLDFDLLDVLVALGPRVREVKWHCAHLQYVSKDEQSIPVLEQAAKIGQWVSGAVLLDGIGQLLQVIDGEFEGLDKSGRRWALLRAVDSSWWEVWSDDAAALTGVRNRFNVVERISDSAG